MGQIKNWHFLLLDCFILCSVYFDNLSFSGAGACANWRTSDSPTRYRVCFVHGTKLLWIELSQEKTQIKAHVGWVELIILCIVFWIFNVSHHM